MERKEKVREAVFAAVAEVNKQLSPQKQVPLSDEIPISGEDSALDSLGFVTFIVSAEQKLEEEIGVTVTLADGITMFQRNGPFRTLGTLIDYITDSLDKEVDD